MVRLALAVVAGAATYALLMARFDTAPGVTPDSLQVPYPGTPTVAPPGSGVTPAPSARPG